MKRLNPSLSSTLNANIDRLSISLIGWIRFIVSIEEMANPHIQAQPNMMNCNRS